MKWIETIHGQCVHPRRVEVLSRHLADIIPTGATVLDVGCGDGTLSHLLRGQRADLNIEGIDVLVRPDAAIKVTAFDGQTLPFANGSFDVVLFVDVLHHTHDPMILLAEAARVARQFVVLKDHLLTGFLSRSTLSFMDRVGNQRHGVVLPYNYWNRDQWLQAFDRLRLRIDVWKGQLGLYPFPGSLVFDRSLHFLASLSTANIHGKDAAGEIAPKTLAFPTAGASDERRIQSRC